MLNRWIKMKRMLHSKEVEKRPTLADECNNIEQMRVMTLLGHSKMNQSKKAL